MYGTVFHKHKYISTPAVTPEDAVIAAAGRLVEALKGNLPHNLGKSSLDELTRLGMLFGQAAAPPAPTSPLQPAQTSPSLDLPAPPSRRSPRLATTVNNYGRIIATPAKAPSRLVNPPLPPWASPPQIPSDHQSLQRRQHHCSPNGTSWAHPPVLICAAPLFADATCRSFTSGTSSKGGDASSKGGPPSVGQNCSPLPPTTRG